METKKEKLEDFKTAISSTVRSLSNSQKIDVCFGDETSKHEKNSIKLPSPDRSNNFNYEEIRAIADSKSLRFRFSSKKTLKKFTRGRYARVKGYKKAIITLKKGQSIDLTTGI